MSVDLDQAYRKTLYRVQTRSLQISFRIGQYDLQTETQLIQCCGSFRQWAIITPCNPVSVALCEQENIARLENLHRWLIDSDYRWLASNNHDPAGAWPDEPGALILDIPLAEAQKLGHCLNQNALVFAQLGSAPELIWLQNTLPIQTGPVAGTPHNHE